MIWTNTLKNLRTEPRLSHDRKKPVRVFLSYTVADREAARQVADALSAAARVRIFTTEMLSAGEDWQSKLRKEIASSDLFVLLLSSETRRSNYVLQELGAAWALDIPVVAVLEHPPFRNLDFHPDMTIASNHTVLLDELRNPDVVQDILSFYDEASEADTAA